MVVGVILARMGSKRITRKNMKLLAGHPLVRWSLEAARNSVLDRLVTSTDDPEILEMAEEFGYAIPRPPELAGDDAPDAPAIRHALQAIQPSGYQPDDLVVHLRPTAPFRTAADIDDVVKRLQRLPADSIISVRPATQHPKKCFVETGETIGIFPELAAYTGASALGEASQGLPKVWHAAGFVDAAKIGCFLREGRMDCGVVIGWPVPPERDADLDTDTEWAVAEGLAVRNEWKPGAVA